MFFRWPVLAGQRQSGRTSLVNYFGEIEIFRLIVIALRSVKWWSSLQAQRV